jgi:SIR2-like domain
VRPDIFPPVTEHDPRRHLEYLRQVLRQDKSPIGFFLSAGCGVSVRQGENSLIPDIAGMTTDVRSKIESTDKAANFKALLETFKESNPNIEDMLSRIRGLSSVAEAGPFHGLDKGALEDLDAAISTAIAELVEVDLPSGQTPHRSLAAWAGSTARSDPVELFTTNYDLLFEQALERVGVPYFDGFVGAHRPFFDTATLDRDRLPARWVRLWKLHGSINWRQAADGVVYRSVAQDKKSPALIHPSHLKYDESRRMPYLAMIDQLRAFLRKRRALLVLCGYSFGDEHLEDVLLQELEGNPTAAAFALMYGDLEQYPRAVSLAEVRPNLTVMAEDAAVVGTRKGKWEADDGGEATAFSVGDFAALGDLLAHVSGELPQETSDAG